MGPTNPNSNLRWNDALIALEALSPAERKTRPMSESMHQLVKIFKDLVHKDNYKKENIPPKQMKELAEKVKLLSKEKLLYYQQSRFGFIKKFFSSLRNALVLGKFTSSGQLGLELSRNLLSNKDLHSLLAKEEQALAHEEKMKEFNDFFANLDVEKLSESSEGIEQKAAHYNTEKAREEIKKDLFNHPGALAGFLFYLQAQILENKSFENVFDTLKDVLWDKVDLHGLPTPQEPETKKVNREPEKNSILSSVETKSEAFKESEKENLKDFTSIAEIATGEVETESTPIESTAQKRMTDDLFSIWEHADDGAKVAIQVMWMTMMQGAKIIEWTKLTDNPKEYQLVIEEKMIGEHSQYPGNALFEKEMKIRFSEEKIGSSEKYRQVISFPEENKPISYKAPYLPTVSLNKILIEKDKNGDTNVKIEENSWFKSTYTESVQFVQDFWSNMNWNAATGSS